MNNSKNLNTATKSIRVLLADDHTIVRAGIRGLLGHAHDANGPYGYDTASAQYDAWIQDVIRNGNLDELLNADPQLAEDGKPDSLWPSLMLAGILKENPLQAKLISYEVNVYFGVLCAEFCE